MKKILFLFFLIVVIGISQNADSLVTTYDPLNKPNTYKNIDNPNYWKNKLPYKDYWQQDVHYKIDAYIDEDIKQGIRIYMYSGRKLGLYIDMLGGTEGRAV